MWYRPTTVLFVFRTRVQLSFKQINQEAGGSVISIKSTKSVKRNACCSSFVQKLFNVCDMCTKPPIGRDMFFCWFTLSDCLLSASNRLLPLSLLSFLFLIMMLQHRRGSQWMGETFCDGNDRWQFLDANLNFWAKLLSEAHISAFS